MPFISKDWRSPGEAWVKTDEGWEKKKVLECCKPLKCSGSEHSPSDKNEVGTNETLIMPPHCQITIKSTKEIAGFNELDEAVKRLDFRSAVRDVRRFNYICALLGLLVGEPMTGLSGCAQRALLAMAEDVARQAAISHHNPRGLRQLLANLRAVSEAERASCWGATLGSQLLWDKHIAKIDHILLQTARTMEIREAHLAETSSPKLLQLPEECLREVIRRLADHRDLFASAEACEQMAAIVDEQRIWRELAKFHFTDNQINAVLTKDDMTSLDWKAMYLSLRRLFGINEDQQYAEMLSLCRYCRCLFWCSLGHPCIADQCPEFRARLQKAGGLSPPSPVPPSAFLKFFSL